MGPPPGWYADPDPASPPAHQRYWTGEAWADQVRPAPPPVPVVMPAPFGIRPDTVTPVEDVDDLAYWLLVVMLVTPLLVAIPVMGSMFSADAFAAMENGTFTPPRAIVWSSLFTPVSYALLAGIGVLDARRNPWFAQRRSAAARFLTVLLFPPVYVFMRDTNAGRGRRRFWTYMVLAGASYVVLMGVMVTRFLEMVEAFPAT